MRRVVVVVLALWLWSDDGHPRAVPYLSLPRLARLR
jgi:hypothetical protein